MTDATSRGQRATAGPAGVPAEVLTSVRNPRVRAAARLARRRERVASGQYLVEGPNAVGEVLAAGDVETLYCTPAAAADYGPDAPVVLVTDEVLARLADSRSPQGVVAVARCRTPGIEAMAGRLVVVLEEPADPGNLGTIVRTADAAGAGAVVVIGDAVDPHNPKAVRASAGSLVHLPVITGVALDEVIAACREQGRELVGLDMAGPVDVFDLSESSHPVALLLGNEAHGLSDAARGACGRLVAVPTHGRAESLNLAVAAGVAMYAAARGRNGEQ